MPSVKPGKKHTAFTPQIKNFINYLYVEKGLAHNSLISYEMDLKKYGEFLEKNKIEDLSRVSRLHITQFLFAEKKRSQAPASIARALVAIKIFHRFLVQENLLVSDVTSLMETPKLWKHLPYFLS